MFSAFMFVIALAPAAAPLFAAVFIARVVFEWAAAGKSVRQENGVRIIEDPDMGENATAHIRTVVVGPNASRAILEHEKAHVERRHLLKYTAAQALLVGLVAALGMLAPAQDVAAAVGAGGYLIAHFALPQLSRQQENEADAIASERVGTEYTNMLEQEQHQAPEWAFTDPDQSHPGFQQRKEALL